MKTEHSIIKEKLSLQNKGFFNENGYLIAPNIISKEAVVQLIQEAADIVCGKRGNIEGIISSPEDLLNTYSAIHFPHKISPLIKDYATNKEIANVLAGVVSPNVKCLQTMLFMKAPGKKGQSWHQDEYFIPTRDKSLIGVWIALDDADENNGCLWIIPGSHKDGYIRRRIKNNDSNFADIEVADLTPYSEKDFLKVEVSAGSVIIFHGYLLHMSLQNKTTNRFRRALVSHYCSAESMLPWDQDGRIDFTHDFRDIFIVAGKDPYEYKGIEDLSKPFVRPDVLKFNTEEHRNELKNKTDF